MKLDTYQDDRTNLPNFVKINSDT